MSNQEFILAIGNVASGDSNLTRGQAELFYSAITIIEEQDADIEQLRDALRKALLWTDEENDVGPWRKEAEALQPSGSDTGESNE